MLEALAGALVGGVLALLGARLAIGWQARHRARTLAAALLAEIEATRDLDDHGVSQRLNQELFAALRDGGQLPGKAALRGLYGISPADAAPVYHASLDEIGVLPADLARSLIDYYASAFGLLRFVTRYLGEDLGLDAETRKAIGASIEAQYRVMLERRDQAVAGLRASLGLGAGGERRPYAK